VWLVDDMANTITKCDTSGKRLMLLGPNGFVTTDEDEMLELAGTTKPSPGAPQSGKMFNRPTDIAVHPVTGELFVTDGQVAHPTITYTLTLFRTHVLSRLLHRCAFFSTRMQMCKLRSITRAVCHHHHQQQERRSTAILCAFRPHACAYTWLPFVSPMSQCRLEQLRQQLRASSITRRQAPPDVGRERE
jgi:hypothetical protein